MGLFLFFSFLFCFFFFGTTEGLPGHLAGAAQRVHPGWDGLSAGRGGKVEHHNTARPSFNSAPLQMPLFTASAGIEGGRGRKVD